MIQNTFLFEINNYQFQNEIGRGASGICYRAQSTTDGMVYAIKKIVLSSLKRNSLRDSMKEVNVLKRLDHPNIIKYHDYFIFESYLYIVMEYCEKGDLHTLLSKKKKKQEHFSEKQIWKICKQLLSALSYLHQNEIVHRDFKTLNIFINKNGNLLVGDLGVSKIVKNNSCLYSRVGTPLYLSPEIIKYEKYDYKADIWGLGCIAYFVTSLSHPFEGKNIITLGQKIAYSEPKKLKRVSHELNEFIFKMLEKNPNRRPSSHELLLMYFQKSKYSFVNIGRKGLKNASYQTSYKSSLHKTNNFSNIDKETIIYNEKENFELKKEKNVEDKTLKKPNISQDMLIYFPSNEKTYSKMFRNFSIKNVFKKNQKKIVDDPQKNKEKSFTSAKIGSIFGKEEKKINNINDLYRKKEQEKKRFTTEGNIKNILKDQKKSQNSREQSSFRPTSCLSRKIIGKKQIKYIKKQDEFELKNNKTRTQILGKPDLIILS